MSNNKESPLKVVVPASTSNLGPGFDTLGLAVNRYLVVETEPSSRLSIEISGEGAGYIPADERNLVVQAMRTVVARTPDVKIKIRNEIPACGGFGASGAAIVAGLLIGNSMAGDILDSEQVYNIAVDIEGHPDNVSAALFGGLVVNARGSGRYARIKIPVDGKLKLVAVLPDSRVETEAARKILPSKVSLDDAVSNVQHSSLLVAAIASGDYAMIGNALKDELHEKHRKKLIPHYDEFAAAGKDCGALGFTVSGAGSSCIAFCLDSSAKVLESFRQLIGRLGLNWRAEIFEPVNVGAEISAD